MCITKQWIVSPTARLVYRTAAVVSLTLFPLLPGLLFDPRRLILGALLFLAVLGTAINAVGMENFLIRFDNSPAWRQVFWFCAMIFVPLGPALYGFVVYSRSDAVGRLTLIATLPQDLEGATDAQSEGGWNGASGVLMPARLRISVSRALAAFS